MNKLTLVKAPSNSITPGTSNPEDNPPSLNSHSLALIKQVLLYFPGHEVVITKGDEPPFLISALPSKRDRSYGADYEWMCRFYSENPGVCVGDDLGTTGGCVVAVLMAATLTGTRRPHTLVEMTSLPQRFVEAVLTQMDAFDLWNSESMINLTTTLRERRENFAKVESALNGVVEEFWDAFYSEEKVAALMTLRERCLFGGMTQHWTDEDAMEVLGV